MLRIRHGDKVLVRVGKDKGKSGIVTRLIKKKRFDGIVVLSVFIEGINLIKKSVKANPNKNITGGISTVEASVDYSNISIINSSTGKVDKVEFKILNTGKKVRVFKSNGEVVG